MFQTFYWFTFVIFTIWSSFQPSFSIDFSHAQYLLIESLMATLQIKSMKRNLRVTDKNQLFLYLQVKRLEDTMSSMKINYEAKFETLSKELETERLLRQKLQEDLKKAVHKY